MSSATYLPRIWLGSQVAPKWLPRDIRPLSAHIKLTENCQAKCISCDYWQKRWPDAISTMQAIDLVKQISGAGIRSLRLTGGEPLLRKDMFQVLREADTSGFKHIVMQTNGLLLKKLHKEVNNSPITKVAVSVDGLEKSNDLIRGINGYFRLAMEGLQLLRGKKLALSVTLNRISARELSQLRESAAQVGAEIETNILSRSLPFFENADIASMWPTAGDTQEIRRFVRDELKRPAYEVEYITRLYNHEELIEPPCVLGFLQVFILSNGDVLTGCYPLKPVGNILKSSLKEILASEEYYQQSVAMVRRECPGCTCGVESSLAMQHSASSAFFEMSRLLSGRRNLKKIRQLRGSPLPEQAASTSTESSPQMNILDDIDAGDCVPERKMEM
jgi:MoaA/NifB/PqqE/SkfB family radical SAM enzyme